MKWMKSVFSIILICIVLLTASFAELHKVIGELLLITNQVDWALANPWHSPDATASSKPRYAVH